MNCLSALRLVFVATLLIGCNPPASLSEPELQNYVMDPSNGVIQRSQQAGVLVTICYQPTDLLGISSPDSANTQPLASQYFLLTLSRNEQEVLDPSQGFSAFSNLLQTLAFRPQEYLRLTTAHGDTLLPTNSELERTYGMGASTRMLIAFPSSTKGEDITVHVNEFGLGTGTLRFAFKGKNLSAIPRLSTNAPTEF